MNTGLSMGRRTISRVEIVFDEINTVFEFEE